MGGIQLNAEMVTENSCLLLISCEAFRERQMTFQNITVILGLLEKL
jgi:hypothetical protein